MIRLSRLQVIQLHQKLIEVTGGESGLRDEALLDSALNAPFHSFEGTELYPTIHQKAARLAFGLIRNHPFVDGNKRIGAHAMLVFLSINGIELEYSQSDLFDIIILTASDSNHYEALVEWIIKKHI